MIIAGRWERRHAEVFADAVDDGAGLNSDLGNDVADLAYLAETLSRTGAATPRPEFAQELRAQLMVEAASVLAVCQVGRGVESARSVGPVVREVGQRRRIGAAVATVVAASVSMGVAAQSARALPGDALYPVKRSVENVRVALERTPAAEGASRLDLAGIRLAEIATIASEDEGSRMAGTANKTLHDFSAQAEQGAASLFTSYEEIGDRSAVVRVMSFAQSSRATLEALAEEMPDSAADSYAAAIETLANLNARAEGLCNGCLAPSLTSLSLSLSSQPEEVIRPDQSPPATRERDIVHSPPPISSQGQPREEDPRHGAPGPDPKGPEGEGAEKEPRPKDPELPKLPERPDEVADLVEEITDPILTGLSGLGNPGRLDE